MRCFERFWLGGEVLGPRVFETRSITPVRYVIIDARNAILDATSDPTGQPSNIFVAPGGVPVPIEIGGDVDIVAAEGRFTGLDFDKIVLAHGDLIALRGRCNAHGGAGDPYLPFREILQRLAGDVEGERAGAASWLGRW